VEESFIVWRQRWIWRYRGEAGSPKWPLDAGAACDATKPPTVYKFIRKTPWHPIVMMVSSTRNP
jgi:hypothetical protein